MINVTNAKLVSYKLDELRECHNKILIGGERTKGLKLDFPDRLKKAFNPGELLILSQLLHAIRKLNDPVRSFFLLALLRTANYFSRAVPDGG